MFILQFKRKESFCIYHTFFQSTMSDKTVLRHLAVKFDFLRLGNIPPAPFPQNNVDFSIFSITQTTVPTTLNWGSGGIRDLTLDANKIEQMLKYRKSSFPKSVSTTFVAHCLEAIYVNCSDFLYISKL